jgi:NADH-quinone oxidoreductase subunit N
MTGADFLALLPLLVMAGSAIVVLLAIALRRSHMAALPLTLAGLGGAFACAAAVWSLAPRTVAGLLVIDHYALFYTGLIAAAAFATALLSREYLLAQRGRKEEFYVLLILATLGAAVLASSAHFATFFLGLELLTVSLYALIGYRRRRSECIEASVKYLVLAGASSAFLLFGMALLYADTGSMQLADFAARAGAPARGIWAIAGVGMLLVGIGFKLAVVPFHLWTPDVYEGAPAPVTGFLATVSKGAMFALLLRYFTAMDLRTWGALPAVFAVLAAASMFAGNLLALRQSNVKRILAYSSIAHVGYMLVAFLAAAQSGSRLAAAAVTFYLTAYFLTTLGAFGVVAALSGKGRDAGDLELYRGLIWRRPDLGGVLAIMLFSLAGIPLTAGFVGKFYLLAAGVSVQLWALVAILVVNSAIGLYYYLRIIVVMCRGPASQGFAVPGPASQGFAEPGPASQSSAVSGPATPGPLISFDEPETAPQAPGEIRFASVALLGLSALVIWLGVYPGPTIDLIRSLFFDVGW